MSPDKDFTMVLGEGIDGRRNLKEKKGRYGTTHERMTSPGRELLREHILTPGTRQMKPKFNNKKSIKSRRSSGRIIVEEVEITSKDGKKRTEIRQSSYISDSQDDDDFSRRNGHNSSSKEESKYREESKSGNFEGNIDFGEAFNRLDRFSEVQIPKIGVDQGVFYCVGPISKYIESPARLPIEEIGNADKISVIKIACGYGHMLVLLENGVVYVVGDNSRGQLGLDPKKFPMVEDKLMIHPRLQKYYEVIDVGCGSNNSVFLVRDLHRTDNHRKILTCGYHGCLGVRDVNEDEFRFQDVKIPDLDDYDKIEFLICKFNSCAVLDSDSNLYYWGDDFDGFRKRVPEKKNYFEKRIVDLSFGLRHAIMLLEDGGIYILGDGKF